jgi:hypothetical protein
MDSKEESKTAESKGDESKAEAKSESKDTTDVKSEAKGGEAKGGDSKGGDLDIVACWQVCGKIVSTADFRQDIQDFVRSNCNAFSDDEENKLEYTDIHIR